MKKLSACSALELVDVITTGSVSASHDACYLFRLQLAQLSDSDRQACYLGLVNHWDQYPSHHERAQNIDTAIYELWCHDVALIDPQEQWLNDRVQQHTEHVAQHKFYALAHAFWKREQNQLSNFPEGRNVFQHYAHHQPLRALTMMHEHVVKINPNMFATTHTIASAWAVAEGRHPSALHTCIEFLRHDPQGQVVEAGIAMLIVAHMIQQGFNLAAGNHLSLGNEVVALAKQLPMAEPSTSGWAAQLDAVVQKVAMRDALDSMCHPASSPKRKI